MRFHVQFQRLAKGALRPTDHPSASDFTVDERQSALIPNVGDYVQIIRLGNADAPTYEGKVRSRLFRFFEAENCGITIVVEDSDSGDWGLLIKE